MTLAGIKRPTDKVSLTIEMTIEAWEQLRSLVHEFADSASYGAFPGGDPRAFSPDPECSTEEERAAHKRDCDAMDAGGQALMPPAHSWERLPNGGVAHVARAGYGLGTYSLHDPVLSEAREALLAAAWKAKITRAQRHRAAIRAGFDSRDYDDTRMCSECSANEADGHVDTCSKAVRR